MRIIFISSLAFLLLVDVALAAYLLWPGGASNQAQEQQLQQEKAQKTQAIGPLRGIDKKLVDTRADIKKFYGDRVPAYWSQISSELHKLEQENGISEQSIHYAPEDSGLPNLQVVKVDTGVASDYVKIAHFINALERDKYVFLIQQISVSQQPAGTVQLQIKFETFLKVA